MSATIDKPYHKPPPPQKQRLPGSQKKMKPEPLEEMSEHQPSGKLQGKVALIIGGDSGIGRSIAILFAKEGADVCIVYLKEHKDADHTIGRIEDNHINGSDMYS